MPTTPPSSYARILIANRGEIACRVMRTARRLGYKTVAVYSDADRNALHVEQADEAVYIGASPARESYLNVDAILAAAAASGADAIHPGYGFLSENAAFAKACADAGIVFIGPPEGAITLMGDKRAAKLEMIKAGVPCVPGYQDADQSDETLLAEGKKVGFPLMVKASAGGGGRGMRLVAADADLAEAIKSARSEAESAFGSGDLILEKAIVEPRHIEIQVFADSHGHVLHLGERDCSVQRRHQKVIEESPSPVVDEAMRAAMGDAAILAAKACDYVGAGTVEFIADATGAFYFLEMNTRLQVEHPVTEMVTGFDLVEWQLRVARGEELPVTQQEVQLSGHSIEVRLYAEDPLQDFMPQTGQLHAWEIDSGVDVRLDSGVRTGDEISPFYDPMIAKLIAHADDRDGARRKLIAALSGTSILGLNSNRTYLQAILEHDAFAAGEATTGFIAEHMSTAGSAEMPPLERWLLAAAIFYLRGLDPDGDRRWIGWRSASQIDAAFRLESSDTHAWVSVGAGELDHGAVQLRLRAAEGGESLLDADPEQITEATLLVQSWSDGVLRFAAAADAPLRRVRFVATGEQLCLGVGAGNHLVENTTHRPPAAAGGAGSGILIAPLDGSVIDLRVAAGDSVAAGDLLAVIEAMKMEHQIKADLDGTVTRVGITVGDQVKTKQVLIELEGSTDEAEE